MPIKRSLTTGEISMAQSVFGDSINYDHVRVRSGRLFGYFHKNDFAKTTLSQIFMHNLYEEDFSKAPAHLQSLFIHEMAHVWQYQQKAFNVTMPYIQNVFHYTPKAYEYNLSDKKDLLSYGIEQQASIIEDYFSLQRWNYSADAKTIDLYKKVLGNFLKNPSYAKHVRLKTLLKRPLPKL